LALSIDLETAASDDGIARVKDPVQNGDVRLIARAAAILRALVQQPHGASLGDLAKATGIPRSTVQRLVNALEAERMVRTNGPLPGVRLGVELCRMAAFVEGDARDILRPYAERLLDCFQETIDITYWDKDVPVVIENFDSPQALRAVSHLGARLPLHCTASGKAHLSLMRPARRSELLAGPLARHTARTKTDPKEVLVEIEASARQGYFLDREEFTEGLCAVAVTVAVPSPSEFSIAIVAPAQRFEANLESYLEKLLETRSSLISNSRRIGLR
jgi:IclR family acetate operon transcriptional repressor